MIQPFRAGRALPLLPQGLLALGGARALAAGLGFLAVLMTARRTTPEILGLWSLVLAVQGHALHVAELGLRSVVTAESVRCRGGALVLLPTYLGLRLTSTLLVYLALVAGSWWLRPDLLALTAIAGAGLIAVALQLDWIPLTQGREQRAAALLLVRPAALLLLLLLWPAPLAAPDLALCYLLAWLAAAIASWPGLRAAPRLAADGAAIGAGTMLALGWPIALVTLLNQLQLGADLLTVGASQGLAAAAHYYLASGVATAALVLANARGQMALAAMGRHRDDPAGFAAELVASLRATAWLAVAVTLPTGAAAVLLLPPLLGPDYGEAGRLVLWLLPWLLLQQLSTLLQAALTAVRGQSRVLSANLLMTPVLAIGLLIAMQLGWLPAFALAKGLAEAARLGLLLRFAPRGRVVGALEAVRPALAVATAGWLLLLLFLA